MAAIGHNVPLATDTHLVIAGNNSFPGRQRKGLFVLRALISLIKEKIDVKDFGAILEEKKGVSVVKCFCSPIIIIKKNSL